MINILIPMAGENEFEGGEYSYPKPLIEIKGKPLIELILKPFMEIKQEKRFIFVINADDSNKYSLDNVLRLIAGENVVIVELENETKGAACSALMAIEYIDNNDSLIIANSDSIINENINDSIEYFTENNVDAGVICFESVHPKWSFVRLDENDNIIETTEKRPISKNAIAGFYYYKNGNLFVEAAKTMILKDVNTHDRFFVSATLNELILNNMLLKMTEIDSDSYFQFYSPHKIKEYENKVT